MELTSKRYEFLRIMSFTNRGKVGNALIAAVSFKGEDSHCGDANYEQSEMVNAKYYREVRQYQAPQHLIRFETARVALTEIAFSSDMGHRNLLTHVHFEWHRSTVRRNGHVHRTRACLEAQHTKTV